MTNEVKGTKEVATPVAPESKQPQVTKKRGITNATRGAARLKFDNSDAQQNGLFLAHIENVEVREINIGEETTGMPSFNGCAIPKLVVTFASNQDEVIKRKYITIQFNAVESNVTTIPGGKDEWKVTSVLTWLKHALDVFYLKGREMTPEEENLLTLNYDDTDEVGDYAPIDSQVVIDAWKELFDNFANIMNTARNGAPVYKDKDGKAISIWLKLLRYVKAQKKDANWKATNNGSLGVPTFVGTGIMEIFKTNQKPSISIDPATERIHMMNLETNKKPNMPIAGIGVAPGFGGGVPVMDGMVAGYNDIPDVSDDMPF